MKQIDLNGITNLQPVCGTHEWYWSMDYTGGDLYEAQELFQKGDINSSHLYIIHYPDGKVYDILSIEGHYFGVPVYNNGALAILEVDFIKKVIEISQIQYECNQLINIVKIAEISLCSVKDCYNLRLHTSPLMLTRQSNDNDFEIIWPEQINFSIGNRESFRFREENKLYFSVWHEYPEYKEEVVVRMLYDGSILETLSGDIYIMPNGEKWNLK